VVGRCGLWLLMSHASWYVRPSVCLCDGTRVNCAKTAEPMMGQGKHVLDADSDLLTRMGTFERGNVSLAPLARWTRPVLAHAVV